jgi:hypothetical protein
VDAPSSIVVQAANETGAGITNVTLNLGGFTAEQVQAQYPCRFAADATWTCSDLAVGTENYTFTADSGLGA